MLCRAILEKIESRYPKRYALDWDNVGLQVGRADKEVQRIYIALDATDEVIAEAASWGADLLLTHHPMIFKPLKQVNDSHFIGRRVLELARRDIAYYAMHTNYDVMGMADLAGEFLELKDTEVLEVTCAEAGPEPDGRNNNTVLSETKEEGLTQESLYRERGFGRVADLGRPMTLRECCAFVKEKFGLPNVKVFGDPEQTVHRLAVYPGSGKGAIGAALEKGADVLVTGDIDHHEGIDALAQGMAVVDAGHYGIEHIFIADMERFCREAFPDLEVRTAPIRQPFWII